VDIVMRGTYDNLYRADFWMQEEIPGNAPLQWEYDDSEFEMVMRSAEFDGNGSPIGELTPSYSQYGSAVQTMEFVNTFHAPRESSFTIQKTVELGSSGKPGTQEFVFFLQTQYAQYAEMRGGVEYWYQGEKLTPVREEMDEYGDINYIYAVPVSVKNDGSATATITVRGLSMALYYSDVRISEYIPSDLPAEWNYDRSGYEVFAEWPDNEGNVSYNLYLYQTAAGEEVYDLVDEIAFVNTYTKDVPAGGGQPDDIVKTGDEAHPGLWALMAAFAAGGLGITAVTRRKKTQK